MWQCRDCKKLFQLPYTEKNCPYCASENIEQAVGHFESGGFYFPTMNGEIFNPQTENLRKEMEEIEQAIDQSAIPDIDPFGISQNAFEEDECACDGDCENCEFEDEEAFEQFLQNENFEGAENFETEQALELSFSDLDINEIVLLNLLIEETVPIDYITNMNRRFLHTFVDSCFMPV